MTHEAKQKTMTPGQLSAICDSFDRACSVESDFGAEFYHRLSTDFPETKKIFDAINMEAQHTRFISMLKIILNRMKADHPVTPLLHDLGEQHGRYGVTDQHFENFGKTLMEVLRDSLGSEYDDNMHAAWSAMYREITTIMKSTAVCPRQPN